MPLKNPLAYIPNFRIQANSARLPTSYPADFVFLTMRAENEERGRSDLRKYRGSNYCSHFKGWSEEYFDNPPCL